MRLKVYCVVLSLTNNRVSRWYEKIGPAKAKATGMNKWGQGSNAYSVQEYYITADEPESPKIPKLEDFDIISVERKVLDDESVYVEVALMNEKGKLISLKGGYDAD